jgi:hypothetical protein
MLQVVRRYGRQFAAVTALALLPSLAQAAVVFHGVGIQPNFKDGPVRFHPSSITIAVNSQVASTAQFKVKQKGNKQDKYKSTIGCMLTLGAPPRVKMDKNIGTITVPPQSILGLSLLCTVTVLGEGGVTGELPVTLDINL